MVEQIVRVFITVFLAELGDKTQLAVLGFAASTKPWAVFVGASLALVTITAIGAAVGGIIGRLVSPKLVNILAGALFVVLGVIYIVKGLK